MLTDNDLQRLIEEQILPRESERWGPAKLDEQTPICTYPWGWIVDIVNPARDEATNMPNKIIRSTLVDRQTGTLKRLARHARDLDIQLFLNSLGREIQPGDQICLEFPEDGDGDDDDNDEVTA